MKNSPKNQKAGQHKPPINLPEHEVWKALEDNAIKSILEGQVPPDKIELKKTTALLDKTFSILLEKVIRQS